MNDPQQHNTSGDDLRNTLREVGVEIGRLLEQAMALAKDAAGDATKWAGKAVNREGGGSGGPLDQIERLGELRDKGFITEQEFQDKKAELLRKVG